MFASVSTTHLPHPDAIVVGAFTDREPPLGSQPEVVSAVRRDEFEGIEGQLVQAFPSVGPRVIVIGLGERGKVSQPGFRKSVLALIAAIAAAKLKNVHLDLRDLDDPVSLGTEAGFLFGLAGFENRILAGYQPKTGTIDLTIASLDGEFDKALQHGHQIAQGTNLARKCGTTPPNIATPLWMAEQAVTLAQATPGLTTRVVQGEELVTENMTGLLNVGRASENPPCLVRIEWNPTGSNEQPLVLLGKTITYDTGGLSLKSKEGMPGMKVDKSGGCAVLGAMQTIATALKPQKRIVAILVAAENSVSDNAYRPDDVILYRNGVSVEVTNTDAEGRLVLADGLCWATEVENAHTVIDIATLTGGVVTALGAEMSGVFANDETLWNTLQESARSTSEPVWRLPLHGNYCKAMESKCADIVNSVPGGKAHPCMGAAFLSHFVPQGLKWTHIDMAGMTKMHESMAPVTGHSGYGAWLLAQVAATLT